MALTYVGGNTGTWVGATAGNNTVSLTALTGGSGSAAQIGDIVIAVYATGSAANRTLTISTGYTTVASEQYANGTTYDTNLLVAFKVLSAADTTVTFGPTGNAQDAGAAAVHVWRGINTATQLDVAATAAIGASTGRPTPPAITPTTAGTIVICAAGGAAATGAVYTAAQLSNFRSVTSADTNDAMLGVGSFAWTSGAFTPTQWTGGTTGATDSWAAITLAMRPSFAQTLTQSSQFNNTNTFYSPTVTQKAPAQPLTQSARSNNTNTFYDETVTKEAVNLRPIKVVNLNVFYNPTVTKGAANLSPARFNNANTIYSLTVTQGTYVLNQHTRFDNVNTFYSPTVGRGAITLTQTSRFNNANVFYSPYVTQGSYVLYQHTRFDNTNTFYPLNVEEGQYDLHQIERLDNVSVFYSPTVSGVLPPAVNADIYIEIRSFTERRRF